MKARFVFEEVRFNFDKQPPYKRYQVKPSLSGPRTRNPKKNGYGGGLTPQEIEIRDRYEQKVRAIKDDIDSLEEEKTDLENELRNLQEPSFDLSEVEEFDAEVMQKYGFNALDILNSGIPDEEKISAIDRLNPEKDFGKREFENLLHNYNYYHPEEPDSELVEKIEKRIGAIENIIKERDGMIDRLENKIYNLENY